MTSHKNSEPPFPLSRRGRRCPRGNALALVNRRVEPAPKVFELSTDVLMDGVNLSIWVANLVSSNWRLPPKTVVSSASQQTRSDGR